MLVHTWVHIISSLGSYPSYSVNIWRYGKQHQGVPLSGDTIFDINNLPPSKYQSFQVQLTTSAPQWVADTCWSVTLPAIQWHLILDWSCMSMAYAHIHNSWAPSYLLQVNYQHFQLFSLNNQHSRWTIQIVHPSTVPTQHSHLGIYKVVQSPRLTDKSYSTHPCLPLDWNLCEAINQHNISCTYNTGIHLDWIPASSIHQHLPQMICIRSASNFLIFPPYMQHQIS